MGYPSVKSLVYIYVFCISSGFMVITYNHIRYVYKYIRMYNYHIHYILIQQGVKCIEQMGTQP